jgi:hypothetical protein
MEKVKKNGKKVKKEMKAMEFSADELEDEESPAINSDVQTHEEFDLGDEEELTPPHKKNLELYIKE